MSQVFKDLLSLLWGTCCFWDCAHYVSEVAGRKVSRQSSSELWRRPWLLNHASLLQRFWAKASWIIANCCELLSTCEVLWNDFHYRPLSLSGQSMEGHSTWTKYAFNSQQPAFSMGMSSKDLTSNSNHQDYSNCGAHRWAGLADPRTSNETCAKMSGVLAMLYRGHPKKHGHTWEALICRTHGRNEQCVLAVWTRFLTECFDCLCLNNSEYFVTIAPSAEVWILQVSYPGFDDHKVGCSVLIYALSSFNLTGGSV